VSHKTLDPARRFSRELELPTVCACKALRRAVEFAGEFAVAREPDVDLLTIAERLHLANGLLHEAWSAVLAKTRLLLLDFLTPTDAAAIWQASR
jgi:hypothetical protein